MIEKLLIGTLNLNDLLVTLEIDNTSPGGAPGGKVPGSQKEMRTWTQQSWDISAREIRESWST